jgi:hypothetical protein
MTRPPFLTAWLVAGWLAAWAAPAGAVPSYARQTGLPCSGCHVGAFGPQLNGLGRQFKLDGYVMSNGQSGHVPLSAMLVESWTHTARDLAEPAGPHDGTNDNAALQQLSLFVAGRLGEHVGMFSQVTYSDIDRKVAMDNFDVRYARHYQRGGHAGTWGLALNNNPGLTDPRHTLAAWRFPFIASEFAPGPNAAPLIDGGLGQAVVGVDGYASIDAKWYVSLGLYRTLSPSLLESINADDPGRIRGAAPYWRVAWTPALAGQSLSIGAYGLHARLRPEADAPIDRYDDIGLDAAYERTVRGVDQLTVNAAITHERNRLDAAFAAGEADRAGHRIDSVVVNAAYYLHDTWGFSGGWFDVRGTRDASLYPAEPDFGSGNGSPSSRGEILQVDWTPWGKPGAWHAPYANLRLGLQYTHYDRLDGASTNYDGFGRDAADSDAVFAFVWLAI